MAGERPETAETYCPTIAVAALDVLGINGLVSTCDKGIAAMNVLSKFVFNASIRDVYGDPTLLDRREQMYEVDLYFGDSMYLFADASRPLDAQVLWLLVRVATLIGLGLWGPPRFLVRGAIAVGDLRKRLVRVGVTDREIRIGTSMTTAHRLQEAQDWIGAAVDAGAPLSNEATKWTSPMEVPLKASSKVDGKPVSVNWIWLNGNLEQTQHDVLAAIRETGSFLAAGSKLANTLEFLNGAYKHGLFAPFERPKG